MCYGGRHKKGLDERGVGKFKRVEVGVLYCGSGMTAEISFENHFRKGYAEHCVQCAHCPPSAKRDRTSGESEGTQGRPPSPSSVGLAQHHFCKKVTENLDKNVRMNRRLIPRKIKKKEFFFPSCSFLFNAARVARQRRRLCCHLQQMRRHWP